MSALNSKSGRPYTFEEEVWSCAIHGLGIVLSIAGLTTLVALAARYRDVWTVVSTAVFAGLHAGNARLDHFRHYLGVGFNRNHS